MRKMSTKDKVIKILKENSGNFVSGEFISSKLGISRNSIWKSISDLRKQGFNIEAVTNKGYCLINSDNYSNLSISPYLKRDMQVKYFAEVTSTNDIALDLGRSSSEENLIIIANEQTNGRGRKGRTFFSPKDTGIYFSLLIKPKLNIQESLYITAIAALSVCKAIDKVLGVETHIKWVNDVFYNNKKICGILTEAQFDIDCGIIDYAAVGIGLNLYNPKVGFPKNIDNIAGSVIQNEELNNDIKSKIVAEIINNFFDYYLDVFNKDKIVSEANNLSFIDEYRKKNFIIGEYVILDTGKTQEKVKVISIDNTCKLEVQHDDGAIEKISYGEISLVI